jgi:DnaJ-class molecular chaperone
MAQDPYTELGVSRSASPDEIRKAFRKLAKMLHPDRNPGDKAAEDRFKRISAAFDILGDPEKKAKFDRGEMDADGQAARGYHPGGGFGGGGFGGETRFESGDFDDILSQVFGRGRPGGGFRGERAPPMRGADVKAKLEIDLEDSINGAVKRISFPDGRTLEVTITKGAVDGQVLRLKGQGQKGRGGSPGDALIELSIRPHPIYRREESDLHMDLPVSVPDAVLGGKVDTPTPEGNVSLTVHPGSNTGTVLRLKGRGAVNPLSGQRGDLFARLVVVLPEGADPELTRIAERWRQERPYKPQLRR